jgi:hypothetical protein
MSVALLVAVAFGVMVKSNSGASKQTSSMIRQIEGAVQSLENLEQVAR